MVPVWGIERPVNGNYRGLFRVFGAVFQRNVQLAARLDAFIPVFPRLLNPFLLGDGEIDAYGIDGGDDGKGPLSGLTRSPMFVLEMPAIPSKGAYSTV